MRTNRRQQQNKKAFDKVILEYLNRTLTSRVGVIDTSVETKGKVNPAAPTDSDFFADVELVVREFITDLTSQLKFSCTYLLGDTESPEYYRFTDGEQRTVEQKVGREFIRRRLYPPEKYFKTEKK